MLSLPRDFRQPPGESSLAPLWLWNDDLSHEEIRRQIDDFAARHIHRFVLHPRVGLPRDCPFMSPRLLGFMRTAIDHAASKQMQVILYDEGMYPSGAAGGSGDSVITAEDSLAFGPERVLLNALAAGDATEIAAERLVEGQARRRAPAGGDGGEQAVYVRLRRRARGGSARAVKATTVPLKVVLPVRRAGMPDGVWHGRSLTVCPST